MQNAIECFKLNVEARPEQDAFLRKQVDHMGFLMRLQDIASPAKFQQAVEAFKTYVTPFKVKDLAQRFINGSHGSNAIYACIEALEKALTDHDTDRLITSLQIIEPLVLNRENAEKCINFDFVKKIGLILVNNKWATFDPQQQKNQTLIRLLMRSLVPMINIKTGRDQFLHSLNPLSHLVQAVEQCKYNVEIVANGLRILRVLTSDPEILNRINTSYKDLANHVVQIMPALQHNSEAKRELYSLL